jgi:hypothetical protein
MRPTGVRLLVLVAALAVATPAAADRYAPYATREAVLGCWQVGAGATLTLTPVGKHSAQATARFSRRPRGGPAIMRARTTWNAAAAAFAVPCRPRTQHGTTCLIAPVAAGLQVWVIAFDHQGRSKGVVESLVAQRCRARP